MAIRGLPITLKIDGVDREFNMPVNMRAFMTLIEAGIDPVILMRDVGRKISGAAKENREPDLEDYSLDLTGAQMIRAAHVGIREGGSKLSLDKIGEAMLEAGIHCYDECITAYVLAFNTGGEERQYTPEGGTDSPLPDKA